MHDYLRDMEEYHESMANKPIFVPTPRMTEEQLANIARKRAQDMWESHIKELKEARERRKSEREAARRQREEEERE